MSIFLMVIGTLAAFSTGSEKEGLYNLSMVLLAGICYACASLVHVLLRVRL